MNAKNHSSDVDVLAWVCGDLSPEQISAAEAAAALDPAIAGSAAELGGTISSLCDADIPPTTAGFRGKLRDRWAAELSIDEDVADPTADPSPSSWRRVAQKAGFALATAAVVALIIVFRHDRSTDGLAWGDVVQAMRQVEHFHVTAFADEPRSVREPRMFRLDLFYQNPGRFRAHGFGKVEFVADGRATLFDIASGKIVDPQVQTIRLVPKDFSDELQSGNILSAVLAAVFQGKPPATDPAKSPDVSAGVEIFDYAVDPKTQWARVWVLKESRLPIRIKVFHPQRDSFVLAEFDYSDRQPPTFFDADAFTRQVWQDRLSDAPRVYAVGSEPVNGKLPKSSDQIRLVHGSSKTPEIRKVFAASNGDLVVVTDSPAYDTRSGRETTRDANVEDSWGNRYLTVSWTQDVYHGDQTLTTWYFTPFEKFRSESGDRKLTMRFISRSPEREAIGTAQAAVPAANDASLPKESEEYLSAEKKGRSLQNYLENEERGPTE